jgi:hypothetical protein
MVSAGTSGTPVNGKVATGGLAFGAVSGGFFVKMMPSTLGEILGEALDESVALKLSPSTVGITVAMELDDEPAGGVIVAVLVSLADTLALVVEPHVPLKGAIKLTTTTFG